MNSAVITPCSHFFHAGCLKKWLYVQETCPLCHSQLKSQSPTAAGPSQDAPAANQNPAGQDETPATGKEKDDSPIVGNGEGDGRTVTPAEETFSGVSPSPQKQETLSSSDPSLSTLVNRSNTQSSSGHHPSSSSSDPPSHKHHDLSSPAKVTPPEPDPTCQASSGFPSDSQGAAPTPTSDQLTPVFEEPCPPLCLWTTGHTCS